LIPLQDATGFQATRWPELVAALALALLIVVWIVRTRRSSDVFVRRIPGLEAVEEAVGRATEMGRPVLFIPGMDSMDETGTLAAVNILGQVAARTARYETRLLVPCRDPIVTNVAQEVVRAAYTAEGRPDLYRADDVRYETYGQFAYAIAVQGIMLRERPATNFFFGRYYAESLIMAETGNLTGAIQIAGTDSDSQLPFFICACDYTLIGEELYAGSVYLSREPRLLGTLKAQDMAKAIVIVALLLGSLATATHLWTRP